MPRISERDMGDIRSISYNMIIGCYPRENAANLQ